MYYVRWNKFSFVHSFFLTFFSWVVYLIMQWKQNRKTSLSVADDLLHNVVYSILLVNLTLQSFFSFLFVLSLDDASISVWGHFLFSRTTLLCLVLLLLILNHSKKLSTITGNQTLYYFYWSLWYLKLNNEMYVYQIWHIQVVHRRFIC